MSGWVSENFLEGELFLGFLKPLIGYYLEYDSTRLWD